MKPRHDQELNVPHLLRITSLCVVALLIACGCETHSQSTIPDAGAVTVGGQASAGAAYPECFTNGSLLDDPIGAARLCMERDPCWFNGSYDSAGLFTGTFNYCPVDACSPQCAGRGTVHVKDGRIIAVTF